MGEHIELGPGGEFDLIREIRSRLSAQREPDARGIAEPDLCREVAVAGGDDAAVTVPGGATATSVDALVEGVHFERSSAPPVAIGHKALAGALSDLAAMGAAPGESYVALGVPESYPTEAILEICDGVAALAGRCGARVLGGDLSRSPVMFLAVTVVGHAPTAAALVGRAGATVGSRLVVTGELGGAAAGHLLLQHPELADALPAEVVSDELRRRQLCPTPQIAAGIALAGAGAEAMIDLSDGLGSDAAHLAAAGGVGLRVELGQLPVQAGVEALAVAAAMDPYDLIASGGEDYELLAVVPPDRLAAATAAVAEAGTTLTAVGEVVAGSQIELRDPDGRLREPRGFDHFQSTDA